MRTIDQVIYAVDLVSKLVIEMKCLESKSMVIYFHLWLTANVCKQAYMIRPA
jgi:hypothetical protein